MKLSAKYITVFTLGIGFMFGWNAFLINRDAKLLKAYDACIESKQHPDCPYSK